jgi:NAD(P)-dependent dehydrogenase (short-subunit alcohol dehydrogenase family)
MSDLFDLSDRRVLVTGACGGLGTALCSAFSRHGAQLLASDREAVPFATLPVSAYHAADLASPAAVDELCRVAEAFEATDLILNAGIEGPRGPLADAGTAEIERAFQINLFAALHMTRRFMPALARRGGGTVVLMASIAALRGNGAIGIYGLTKAALTQLARTLAVEWGPRGIRANAICPGMIETALSAPLLADPVFRARRMQATPLRRPGRVEEVAGTAVWLVSKAGGFVTGQSIVVDGGTLISDGS